MTRASGATKKKVSFTLTAPDAQSVLLAGCFTNWDTAPVALKRQKGGAWKTTISLSPGSYHYRFLVDGQWQDDPACTTHAPNPFGTQDCVLHVAAPQAPTP